MPRWPWTERKFTFDFPPSKLPDLLERIRGTPVRVEALVSGLDSATLTRRDDLGWSIQENIGHLIDLGYLPVTRIDEILAGQEILTAADMSNRKTIEARHHERGIADLLTQFRSERDSLVAKFESLAESDWGKSALHPRIRQPLRIVDIAYFDSEHDDYHLARMRELRNKFAPGE